MNAIEVVGVSKKFRKIKGFQKPTTFKTFLLQDIWRWNFKKEYVWALKDVNFSVKEGEAVAIIGRNGAGKTTLLRIMSKIIKPDEGTVKVRGRVSPLIELGAGFHPELTGRENIIVNGIVLGLSKKKIKSLMDQIIAFAELEEFIDSPLRTYSAGMYMRLGFSVAVHAEPQILLIDEVFAVGDLVFVKKCMDKMNEFKREGKTIIVVTHDLKLASNWCDRVLWLHEGKVRAEGTSTEVVKMYENTFKLEGLHET
jgi:ABC-type polysaccharide/polyol phosphate transport system ATPase subunit